MIQLVDVTIADSVAAHAYDDIVITFQNVKISNCPRQVVRVRNELLKLMTDLNYSWPALCAMQIAISEALKNAMEHGNGNDPTKSILVSHQIDSQCAWVAIEDEGLGFDAALHIADIQFGVQSRCARHGLALIRRCCDEFGITPPGNRIELLKHNA